MSQRVKRTDGELRVEPAEGVSVSFALDGDRMLGIRSVEHGGVALRNPAKLWRPYFYTPEGIHYSEFRLVDVEELDGGAIRVVSERFRTREANRKECCRKLAERIVRYIRKPKKRVPTKPTAASKKRRLEAKKRISRIKSMRRRPTDEG